MNSTQSPAQTATIETRDEKTAAKAGNFYTFRAVCATCGYKGKWTGGLHAEDLAEAHRCWSK